MRTKDKAWQVPSLRKESGRLKGMTAGIVASVSPAVKHPSQLDREAIFFLVTWDSLWKSFLTHF